VWGLLATLAAAQAVGAEEAPLRQSIRGTRISLEVPAGFRVSEDFPGIGRVEEFSSVMVTELDVPVEIAVETFSKPALERRGIEMQRSGPALVDGRPATLVHATQRIGGMTFRKWFLLLGDETRSVLLTATTPIEQEQQHGDVLVHVLSSAHWSEARGPEPAQALPFRVKEAPPLRFVRSSDAAVVLSDPQAASGHVAPIVTVGASRAQVEIDDLAAFARERLEETVSIHEIAVESEGPQRLGGLAAHQIVARARDAENGRAVRVRQILAHDDTRYYLVQGVFDAEDAARLEPAFDAVAASFALSGAGATP
jgi:hypothetical protein